MIEDFEETSTMKELKRRLSEKEEELQQAKEEGDNDSVDIINEIIEELNAKIEEEEINPTEEQHFKSYKCVRRQFINNLIKEYKQNNINGYNEIVRDWRHYYELWIDYGCESDHKLSYVFNDKMNKLNKEFSERAEKVVSDMEENNQFEQYYLIHSGKLEYQQKVDKINAIKAAQTKLNDVIEDYTTKQSTLTTDDFKTFVSLWNEYIDEPLTIDLTPIIAKYNGRIIEIYKINVADSIHKDRIQCSDMNGKPIDKQNVYIKFVSNEQTEKTEDVKPIDVIIHKNETYEVYNTNVEGSEFCKRVNAHSTTTNKKRDFKNKYLKKVQN